MTQASSRHLVDPELFAFLEMLPAFALSDDNLQTLRQTALAAPVDPELAAKVMLTQRVIPGPAGAPMITIHCYRPRAMTGVLPCIFHIHGGGFVAGRVGAGEGAHTAIVLELGCALVSVDYRLAPETRFPGPVEDCYAALAWLFAHAEEMEVDPARIGVMGESAGGGLAAALALLARDRGEYALAFQHLIYPMLDDRTSAETATDPHPFVGEYLWTHHNNRYGWGALLGHEPGMGDVSPYAAAARAESVAGLPPTFIATGSLDLFLEEDLEYARRLTRAGVPTELHVYPGGFHAFDLAPGAEIAARAQRDSRAALSRALAKRVGY